MGLEAGGVSWALEENQGRVRERSLAFRGGDLEAQDERMRGGDQSLRGDE